jgi:hypothetical protein
MARESMSDAWRLLLIDDNSDDRLFVRRVLARELDALEVQEAGAQTLARAIESGLAMRYSSTRMTRRSSWGRYT